MTHTQGPWRIGEYLSPDLTDSWAEFDRRLYERAIYSSPNQTKIATCEQWIGDKESLEAEANARLIAAAPDLLSVAQAFAEWHADHFEDFDSETNKQLLCLANDAQAAIAKATNA